MNIAGKFEKVSKEQFCSSSQSIIDSLSEFHLNSMYDNIKLPKRATIGSAGYDFFSPFNVTVYPGGSIVIPTGIRCKMNPGWVLKIYPRSGLGFKYKLQLMNTVGIIDQDYYNSDNEGHIMIKVYNDSPDDKDVQLEEGKAFAQGVFVEYGITEDDEVSEIRNGGFSSTDK